MTNSVAIVEHGLIRNERDFPDAVSSLSEVFVSSMTFRYLCSLAADVEGSDTLFTVFWQKGRETIRVRNYVGLIGLPDGTYLEILPKIGRDEVARTVLLSMLRHVRHSPFRTLTPARMSATHLPLWEVFILAFLDLLEPFIRQGVQCAYVTVERNEPFVRGKFQTARHQRENAHSAERLAVAYDRLTPDCPPNRVLKTALVRLQNQSLSLACQQRMRQLNWALADVPVSESVRDDLEKARRHNRLFRAYEPALQWAEALLNGQAFGVKSGQFLTISLLFPMQRVFEDYVAHAVRRYWPEGTVTVQESSAHLVEEHGGAPKFKLRPDMLIRHDGRTLVLDTKWQHIKGSDSGTNAGSYGVQQPDLYQLYAYGKKYEADDVFLIYPANEQFQKPLDRFGYDADMRLHVVPFDVTNPPADEVETLAAYALSFRQ